MSRATWCLMVFGAVFALVLCGCGGSDRPELVDVTGTVTYQGKPVENAKVVFQNDLAPRAATGTTDAEGRFTLSTFGRNDGAVPGEHFVTVSKLEASADVSSASAEDPSAAYERGMAAAASGHMDKIQENELPEKYGDPKTTDIKITVTKDGENKFEINLD